MSILSLIELFCVVMLDLAIYWKLLKSRNIPDLHTIANPEDKVHQDIPNEQNNVYKKAGQ